MRIIENFGGCSHGVYPSLCRHTNKQKDVKGISLSAMSAYAEERIFMCGIIGYCGVENSVPKLIDGLKSLEYRGYDSAGIAVFTENGISVIKAKGRISNVEKLLDTEYQKLSSSCGIGHTRWATHGEPSDTNSHPHGTENLKLVHNGIIENYTQIKKELTEKQYDFQSDTDTEIAAKLVDYNYKITNDPIKAIRLSTQKLEGSYAFGIIFKNIYGKIFATRKESPLIVALSENGNYIASDIPAVLKHTNTYFHLEKGEIAIVEKDKVTVYDSDDKIIEKEILTADWDMGSAEKCGFDHFMLKEIYEERDAVLNTLRPRVKKGLPCLEGLKLSDEKIKSLKKISVVACGTAMHAGLIGKAALESMARIPGEVEIASEFRYKNPIIDKDDLVIVISQSGETADSLAALRLAKEKGAHTIAIVNVPGSSIAREAESTLYTWAGPEIAVASTKAYTVQISLLYLISIKFALEKEQITEKEARSHVTTLLENVPNAIDIALKLCDNCKGLAEKLKDARHLFFIGRGIDYDIAREASLKLKEISYIHSEAYAAGEMKHGTISLITDNLPIIAICTQDSLLEKTASNIKEAKSRGARVFLVCKEDMPIDKEIAEDIIPIPKLDDIFMAIPAMTILQLVAYYTSLIRGCDIDKPRNLAKSVTVE